VASGAPEELRVQEDARKNAGEDEKGRKGTARAAKSRFINVFG
jgi:hypothetical protein